MSGVLVESGTGDSILSNSIFGNGMLGIDLVAPGPAQRRHSQRTRRPLGPNNLQNYPVLTTVTSNGSLTHIQGTLNSLPNTSFLIQFFTNSDGRSQRVRPGTDSIRFDPGDHRCQRHTPRSIFSWPRPSLRVPSCRQPRPADDQPDAGRHLGIRARHRRVLGVSVHSGNLCDQRIERHGLHHGLPQPDFHCGFGHLRDSHRGHGHIRATDYVPVTTTL